MRVDKMSVSFEIQLGDNVRHAAEKAGKPLSTWLAEAAATKLRAEALSEFLDDWEAEHGAFTEERERHVRQRREIAGAAEGAVLVHQRGQPGVAQRGPCLRRLPGDFPSQRPSGTPSECADSGCRRAHRGGPE